MRESRTSSKLQTVVGGVLLALGIAVFAVRLVHEGPYAVPRGGNLFGGLGALLLGGVLVWSGTPRGLGWLALAASPVVLFFGLYATMAELEEVVSLYATDRAGTRGGVCDQLVVGGSTRPRRASASMKTLLTLGSAALSSRSRFLTTDSTSSEEVSLAK